MVMAAPVVLVLVTGNAVVERDFAGQSTLSQQLERAIDRCVADARVLFLHQAVQLVGGEVIAGFEKCAQDRVALASLLQADSLEMAVKYVLGLAHHLTRDRGLVVDTALRDALLEHEASG